MHGGHSHAHHDHTHHGHAHHDHGAPGGRRYYIAILLNVAFVIAEAAAGFVANSTALIADAGHNLSDVMGLVLAAGAAWLAGRAPGGQRTYGFGKAGVLAALANGLLLVGASGAIAWEAARRLLAPQAVEPGLVIWVAAAGFLLNTGSALLFVRGRKNDLNVRGAFLHMAADAAVSLGVLIAGLVIWRTGAAWIDPAASLIIVAVIGWGAYGLIRDAANMALDAAPPGVDVAVVRTHLAAIEGVEEVHDLHIWAMSASETALTAHLVRPQGGDDALLASISTSLKAKFGIAHATVQIEHARHGACDEHAHP
jgi:cobalt-zinc-cadmium efflux system protein